MTNGCSIQVTKEQNGNCPDQEHYAVLKRRTSPALSDYDYDFFSQTLSEGATRGIFGWLRSTGYPRSERPIYQHSWIDLEGMDEEEAPDDAESDMERQWAPKKQDIESWLDGVE